MWQTAVGRLNWAPLAACFRCNRINIKPSDIVKSPSSSSSYPRRVMLDMGRLLLDDVQLVGLDATSPPPPARHGHAFKGHSSKHNKTRVRPGTSAVPDVAWRIDPVGLQR